MERELQRLTGEVGGGGGGVQDLSKLAVAAVGLDVGQSAACMSQDGFVIAGLHTSILLLTKKPLQLGRREDLSFGSLLECTLFQLYAS